MSEPVSQHNEIDRLRGELAEITADKARWETAAKEAAAILQRTETAPDYRDVKSGIASLANRMLIRAITAEAENARLQEELAHAQETSQYWRLQWYELSPHDANSAEGETME